MVGHGIRKLMRCLRFSLGIVVAFSGSLFFLLMALVRLRQVSRCRESLLPRVWIWIVMIRRRGLST